MSETLYLILGIIVLVVIISDFFFTTLSISGAGIVTKTVSATAHLFIQKLEKIVGRGIYSYSGLIINLLVLLVWIILIWLGLFFIYSSHPEAIVNSKGAAASTVERLYFTGYVLSTLGMGNFYPTTVAFETLTSIFSFFGFIFFTSSITYFLSVSTAVTNKRTFSRSVQNLGKTPQIIVDTFLRIDSAYAYQQLLTFQQLLDKHVVHHQAYPVIHYYGHPKSAVSLSLNLARLDEALSILLTLRKSEKIKQEVTILRTTVTAYLTHVDANYTWSFRKPEGEISSELFEQIEGNMDKNQLEKRRRILTGLLRSEGFEWEDIGPQD